MGLNVVVGLAGVLDSATSRFMPWGALSYAAAGDPFRALGWVCLRWRHPRGVRGSAVVFRCCGCAATNLAIVHAGIREIIRLVIINWQSLTGGPNGVSGIRADIFRHSAHAGR